MPGSSQPEDRLPPAEPSFDDVDSSTGRSSSAEGVTAAGLGIHESRSLEVTELDSALQLLVERAQYITGATGAALALPENEEMVCRASAGSSAPEVGARLQVRSGLTAESIVRRQLLRCDNAETDPRVNWRLAAPWASHPSWYCPCCARAGKSAGCSSFFPITLTLSKNAI